MAVLSVDDRDDIGRLVHIESAARMLVNSIDGQNPNCPNPEYCWQYLIAALSVPRGIGHSPGFVKFLKKIMANE